MVALKSKQKGFTIIELMVALTLSLSILAGLLYSVLGDMRAYESTRSTIDLSTKGRMSMQLLRLYIQQAGFRDFDQVKLNVQIPASSLGGRILVDGQILTGWDKITAVPSGVTNPRMDSDILAIRFLGASEGIFSCDGSAVINVVNGSSIFLFVNTNNELICQDASGTVILGEDVEYLRLLYGMNSAFGAAGNNNFKYYDASQINSANWNAVNRIKVGMLISQNVNSNHLINGNSYNLFDRQISAANDTNFRNVISETVLIRNQ
jgi:type IV pilus assembly protein PilW